MPTLRLQNKAKRREFQRKDYYLSAKHLFNSEKWKKMRVAQLSKHPICERCEHYKKTTLATHVDHVHAHQGDKNIFFNSALSSLCHACHSWKTCQEALGKFYSWKNGEEQVYIKSS